MNMTKKVLVSSAIALGLVMSGCGGDSTDEKQTATQQAVSIDFEAMMGDEVVMCSENNISKLYSGVGTSDENVTITDFRLFISEIQLVKADGSKVSVTLDTADNQYQASNGDQVAFLDFENATGDCVSRGNTPETYTQVTGKIAKGTYTALEFTLGVPFDINHDDSYEELVLNEPKMSWNWQAGRKFTKIELKSQTDPSLIWNFHLGSTGCIANSDINSSIAAESCKQPNRVNVVLNDFTLGSSKVKIDYKALVESSDVAVDNGGAKGCMSGLTDPECSNILTSLALDVPNETGECINGGDCSSQKLFSLIND